MHLLRYFRLNLPKFIQDERGFVVSIELVLVSTVAIIGLITGFTAIRDAVVSEVSDVGGSIQDLNQSYTFNGIQGRSGDTAGSNFIDARDWCDDREDPRNRADNCIAMTASPRDET